MAGQEKTNDEPDFEVVEEGSEEAKKLAQGGKVEDEDDSADEGDERLGHHAGDAPVGGAGDTDENSKKNRRKRQRQRMKEQLSHKDSIIRSLNQKLSQQDTRLSVIERRTGATEGAMIEKAIADTRALVENAASAHSHALTTGDPQLVTHAMNALYDTRRQLEGLETLKTQVASVRQAPQATDQGVARNVNAWMARNSWYRPDTGDEDSLIAKVIDNKLADEGYDPRTSEYWDELDRRISKRLPDRAGASRKDKFDDEDDDGEDMSQRQAKQHNTQAQGSKSNVSGSGQGAGAQTRVKVVLSKERVQALKDAGMWEDTKQRNKMIRQYQDFDRANSAN